MLEIQGKYNKAIVYIDNIEEQCFKHIQDMCNCFVFEDCKIRIMPDTHDGKGSVIGFTSTMPKDNMIIPNIVGVDINCGMLCVKLKEGELDYERLDNIARQYIPLGAGGQRDKVSNLVSQELKEKTKDICKKIGLEDYDKQLNKIGTLGSGNHFISIEEGKSGKYLIIHSGSRNVGLQIAIYYQKKAEEYCDEKGYKIQKDLNFIQGKDSEDYLQAMKYCEEYAKKSREVMAYEIINHYGLGVEETFTTIHNYINLDDMIIRKGAISCKEGEKVLIPINMAYGSFIVVGKGNDEWNKSAPHGAGRLLSRSKAKEELSMEEFEKSMQGIYTTSVCKGTLDESPMAYKNGDEIKELIKDTGDIIDHLIPKYNLKSSK